MSSTLSPRVILQTALEQYDEAEWHDTLLAYEETHHDEFYAALKVVEAVRAVLAEPAADKALREAVRKYLMFLNGDISLGDPEFGQLKARVITAACNVAAPVEPEVKP